MVCSEGYPNAAHEWDLLAMYAGGQIMTFGIQEKAVILHLPSPIPFKHEYFN